jgi:hypothetical protein
LLGLNWRCRVDGKFAMGIPVRQSLAILSYILKRRLSGVERYPLVLMLEPLFRCNLACAGCGKIDYQKRSWIGG